MITFEQYINSEAVEGSFMSKTVDIVTAPPINLISVSDNTIIPSDFKLLASRSFDIEKNNIYCSGFGENDIDGNCNRFGLQYRGTTTVGYRIYLSYPQIKFTTSRCDIDVLVKKWDSINFFTMEYEYFMYPDHISRAKYKMDWKEFNFYESLQGSKIEKIIKTLEWMKEKWQRLRRWNDDMERLLIRLRLQHLPKEILTKRDYIRGAMLDI